MSQYRGYVFWSAVIAVVAVGVSISSYHCNPAGSYALIGYIALVSILVVLKRIPSECVPLVVASVSAGLVLQTTMYGTSPIGTDIQVEMFFSNQIAQNGWHPGTAHLYNMSIVTIGIIPFLTRLGIDTVWTMKALMPIFLIATPVVLYVAFHKFFNYKMSYLAVLFLMIMPAFSLVVPTIAKQEVAEFFLALLVLVSVSRIGTVKKTILVTALLSVTFLSHYSIGLLATMIIAVIWFALILNWLLPKMKLKTIPFLRQQTSPAKCYGIALVVFVAVGVLWTYSTGGGERLLVGIGNVLDAPESTSLFYSYNPSTGTAMEAFEFIQYQEAPIQTAIGIDFDTTVFAGKVFRVVQYITELLIVIGVLAVVLNRRKLPTEIVAGSVFGLLILLVCIVVPQVSKILGVARLYHLTLFFLSPLLLTGLSFVLHGRSKTVSSIGAFILLAYFVFTSGMVYEITGSTTLDRIETPYSIALSNSRLNIVGTFTNNDRDAAEWLAANSGDCPIAADDNTLVLLRGYVYPRPKLYANISCNVPYGLSDPPADSYVFFTEWNMRESKVVRYVDMGMRRASNIEDDILETIQGKIIVFQKGDAVVFH